MDMEIMEMGRRRRRMREIICERIEYQTGNLPPSGRAGCASCVLEDGHLVISGGELTSPFVPELGGVVIGSNGNGNGSASGAPEHGALILWVDENAKFKLTKVFNDTFSFDLLSGRWTRWPSFNFPHSLSPTTPGGARSRNISNNNNNVAGTARMTRAWHSMTVLKDRQGREVILSFGGSVFNRKQDHLTVGCPIAMRWTSIDRPPLLQSPKDDNSTNRWPEARSSHTITRTDERTCFIVAGGMNVRKDDGRNQTSTAAAASTTTTFLNDIYKLSICSSSTEQSSEPTYIFDKWDHPSSSTSSSAPHRLETTASSSIDQLPKVWGHTCECINQRYLVLFGGQMFGGGWNQEVYVSDCTDQNRNQFKWRQVKIYGGSRPAGRHGHKAAVLSSHATSCGTDCELGGPRMLIFGGWGSRTMQISGFKMNDLWVLQFTDDSFQSAIWTQLCLKGDLPSERCGHVMEYFDGNLYVFGGRSNKSLRDNNQNQDSDLVYDDLDLNPVYDEQDLDNEDEVEDGEESHLNDMYCIKVAPRSLQNLCLPIAAKVIRQHKERLEDFVPAQSLRLKLLRFM